MADDPLIHALREKRTAMASMVDRVASGEQMPGLDPVARRNLVDGAKKMIASLDASIDDGEPAAND